jgi:hypothetical protein
MDEMFYGVEGDRVVYSLQASSHPMDTGNAGLLQSVMLASSKCTTFEWTVAWASVDAVK